jgi:AcrR family transcriptional regulator
MKPSAARAVQVGDGTTRERILRAAAALFRRQGFKATSMQDIAEQVGLTKSSLYHHIRGKHDLLYEILLHTVEGVIPAMRAIACAPRPASQRLRDAVACHVVRLVEDLDNVVCFIEEGRSLRPARRKAYVAKRDLYEGFFRQILQDGVDNGEFAPVDVRLAGWAILGMANWIARWYNPDGEWGPNELAAQFGEFAVRAVSAGPFPLASGGEWHSGA